MSIYGFKPNPKQLAFDKAKNIFGPLSEIEILGARSDDRYHVTCSVNKKVVSEASDLDWRKAYKQLTIQISQISL